MSARAARWAVAVVVLGGASIDGFADEPEKIFIGQLTLRLHGRTHLPSGTEAVELHLEVVRPADAQRILSARFGTAKVLGKEVAINYRGYVPLTQEDSPDYSQPSYLIDFRAPVFEAIDLELRRRYGEKPKPVQLAQFANEWIKDKNLSRTMDPAATVARRREGDCTEHATLLAALLRRHGYSARVVEGIVFMTIGKEPAAFGHAWVELKESGTFRGIDATGAHRTVDAAYLALGPENESAFPSAELVHNMQILLPSAVVVY